MTLFSGTVFIITLLIALSACREKDFPPLSQEKQVPVGFAEMGRLAKGPGAKIVAGKYAGTISFHTF